MYVIKCYLKSSKNLEITEKNRCHCNRNDTKLRDITIDDIMNGKTKKPTFNDWGECATRIVHMYRYVSKLQEQYQFHLAISGHEGINKDKDDEDD